MIYGSDCSFFDDYFLKTKNGIYDKYKFCRATCACNAKVLHP